MAKDFKPSPDLQAKIDVFEGLNKAWKGKWDAFYQAHSGELDDLDDLREKRNIALDEATRAARDEASGLDIMQHKFVRIGPLSVQKKETKFFIPEAFVATAKELEVYDKLVEKGAIVEKVDIPFKEARGILEEMGLLDSFLHCEDGKELTPAVSGPKNIPPLAAEYKEK